MFAEPQEDRTRTPLGRVSVIQVRKLSLEGEGLWQI
jgi:hypothetical protein